MNSQETVQEFREICDQFQFRNRIEYSDPRNEVTSSEWTEHVYSVGEQRDEVGQRESFPSFDDVRAIHDVVRMWNKDSTRLVCPSPDCFGLGVLRDVHGRGLRHYVF